jgi:Ulp1 family protease
MMHTRSLLAFHRPTLSFRHYDSSSGVNRPAARRLARALRVAVAPGAGAEPILVDVMCPRQVNGYDCGVYVLALARWLCERHTAGSDIAAEEAMLASWLTPQHVTAFRAACAAEVQRMVDAQAAAATAAPKLPRT